MGQYRGGVECLAGESAVEEPPGKVGDEIEVAEADDLEARVGQFASQFRLVVSAMVAKGAVDGGIEFAPGGDEEGEGAAPGARGGVGNAAAPRRRLRCVRGR